MAVKSWTIWTTAETLTKTDLPPGPNLDRLDRQLTSSFCKDRMSLEVGSCSGRQGGRSIASSNGELRIDQEAANVASVTLDRGCADFVLFRYEAHLHDRLMVDLAREHLGLSKGRWDLAHW